MSTSHKESRGLSIVSLVMAFASIPAIFASEFVLFILLAGASLAVGVVAAARARSRISFVAAGTAAVITAWGCIIIRGHFG